MGANDFIGTVSVDLHTLATGPVFHDILMRDGGKPSGRLQFCCEFEMYSEVEMTLKSVEVSGLQPVKADECDPYLQYYFSAIDNDADGDKKDAKDKSDSPFAMRASGDGKKYRTPARMNTTSPTWDECDQMWFQVTLRELMQEAIVVRVLHANKLKRDVVLADCRLPLASYCHPSTNNRPIKFAEPLRLELSGGSGRAGAARIEGFVVFNNVPLLAQMVGGKHTESGVEGGRPLTKNLPMPNALAADVVDLTRSDNPVVAPTTTTTTPTPTTATTATSAASDGDAFLMVHALQAFAGAGNVQLQTPVVQSKSEFRSSDVSCVFLFYNDDKILCGVC